MNNKVVRFHARALFWILLLMEVSAPPSQAVLGVGDVVFDPQAYQQQLINYGIQLRQYSTQMQQYANQIEQLRHLQANMQNLGFKSNLSGLNQSQQIMHNAQGISNDFTTMQRQFEKLYPDYATYQKQTGDNYAEQSRQWSQNTQQNARDMLTYQTQLQEYINQDQGTLRYLNDRSDSASGTKDLLQNINQLLILQNKQLMQLQQLIGVAVKANAAFMAGQASNDEASRAASENIYRDWTKKGDRTPAPKLWDRP